MHSLWTADLQIKKHQKLSGDVNTDVLVIGGGMAGILCAYQLQQKQIDYCLVEADEVGCGVTGFTTAKITSQHALIYHKIVKRYGIELARQYYDANENAIEKYEQLSQEISCDFLFQNSYVYDTKDTKNIEKELRALEQIKCPAEFVKEIKPPISVAGAVKFQHQAQFNPAKFITAIADELNIYEHTMVRELEGTTAICDAGKIYAKKVIIATHFPFINTNGAYFIKMHQHRSYVIALEGAEDVEGMYVDADKKGMSFRDYEDKLILVGGAHRTGKKGGKWEELHTFAVEHYPKAKEVDRWATQDCITLDGIPYIGQYSKNLPNVFVATGFNKWGMTSSMVAANILIDMVMEIKNPYAKVFSPTRSIWHPQLFANLGQTIINFATPSSPRCTHLGCALKWNPEEETWDCSCHGSRYEKDGTLINNPAMKDSQKKA